MTGGNWDPPRGVSAQLGAWVDLGSPSLMMKRERKRGGLWPLSRMTIGSGLPRTVLVLTLELLCLGQPLRPYKPYSGVRATERDTAGVFGNRGKKSTSSWSPRVQPAVERHLPQTLPARTPLARPSPALPCPDVGPVQGVSGGEAVPSRRGRAAGADAERAVCGSRTRSRG